MKNKAFTLIELLAVIVILAIIALIVVPIVLNIIDDADKESEADSAKMYIHAVELAIAKTNMSTRLANATCTVQVGGNLSCDGKDIEVDINNKDQIKGVTITIERRKVTKVTNLKVGNGTYNMGSDGKLVLGEVPEPEVPQTQVVYRWTTDTLNATDDTKNSLEGISTTTDYTTLNKNFFLKHEVENNKITSSEVCFIKDNNLYCLKPNDYENSKATLLQAFGEDVCSSSEYGINCSVKGLLANASSDGNVGALDVGSICRVKSGGNSSCGVKEFE